MFKPLLLNFLANFNSAQETSIINNAKFNLPQGGGKSIWRRNFIAPAGGVAINDTITFGNILPGTMFNPAAALVHWSVGTATADLDLGHLGFSNIDGAGVVTDVAASVDEFLNGDDLASANLIGSAMLNARIGGIYVSSKNAAGAKVDGLVVQGKVLIAGMPAGQEIVVEIPIWTA